MTITESELSTTPEQVAAGIAAGALSPVAFPIAGVRAVHESGVVVDVFPDADGGFDEAAPVFVVTLTPERAALHADLDQILTAAGYPHTDKTTGFDVPDLAPFALSDPEAVRWLAAKGIVMKRCEGCDRVVCVCPGRPWIVLPAQRQGGDL